MATRSEQFRAEAQRKSRGKKRTGNAKPGKPARAKKHAEKKATFALEETGGKRSRKSSRKSANRAKPESTLEIREQIQKGSPERVFERAAARKR